MNAQLRYLRRRKARTDILGQEALVGCITDVPVQVLPCLVLWSDTHSASYSNIRSLYFYLRENPSHYNPSQAKKPRRGSCMRKARDS
jgi:hypothetical protein